MTNQRFDFTAEFFKALSNPCRLRIIKELRRGELTVTEIRDRLNLELPNVSQQLAVLRAKQLVVSRKQGSKIFYACSDETIFKLLDQARSILTSADDPAQPETSGALHD